MQVARPPAPSGLAGLGAIFCLSASCGAFCRCRSMGRAVPLCGLPDRPVRRMLREGRRGRKTGGGDFAASTRVLCGKYSGILREVRFGIAHALSRFPVRAEKEKWVPAKSFSPRCSPFSAESINFAHRLSEAPL